MKKNPFNNLFWRISAIFFFLLVFTGLSFIYITVHYSGLYFEEINQKLNKNTAADIAAHSTPFTDGKVNDTAMEKMFDQLMSVNPSLEIYLLDNSGKILSYYAPQNKVLLDKIDLEPVRQFIDTKGSKYITGDDPHHPGLKKIFSAARVISNGLESGFIYAVLASEEYDTISRSLTKNYLLKVGLQGIIITLVVALLVGLIIIGLITRNFSKILAVMQQFKEGDISARVKVQSVGDVKQVGDIFNEMADILSENIEKLKEVEVLRRELIANVSHDLRTPIAIIQGYIETLQMKSAVLSEEERKKYLDIISESTGKLQKLVAELFELSKLEAKQVKPVKEPFFISELVNDIISNYQLIAKEKNISITTLLSKDLPPVFADVALIERVMQNLIDNAMKFTPGGGKITITTNIHDQEVEVKVADTGIGIPEAEREQIFGRYYKAKNFTDLKNSTGLGLAIIRNILDLHHSSLQLISEINSGSTFVFRLPIYQK
ncbi:MAG: HAMP domain-containing sensor histidine kinase [Saprospiraceae bacterium]